MRPSPLLAVPLLLVIIATFVVDLTIAAADEYTAAAPAPSPLAANPPPPPPAASPLPPPPPPAVSPLPPPPPPVDDDSPAWSPVTDVEDMTIRQVGQFAVRVYCLNTGAQLAFVNVVGGQTQPYGGGARYQLVITVAAPAAAGPGAVETTMTRYGVLVWGILGTTTWQLWDFAPKN